MRFPGIAASLALASLTSGVLANPASGKQGQPDAVAPGKVTETGVCGKANGFICTGSTFGQCCSASGRCGSSVSFCGEGCQSNYGSCGARAITSYAEGAPLERLKNILKNIGLSRHQWKPPHNGTHHANNGTFGAHNGTHHGPHNGTFGIHNGTHPGHRGFHKHNVTGTSDKLPKKGLDARDGAEGEVAPRCERDVEGGGNGDDEIAARRLNRATNSNSVEHTSIHFYNLRLVPVAVIPPVRACYLTVIWRAGFRAAAPQATSTNTRGTPSGRFSGPPPSGTPPARPTGSHPGATSGTPPAKPTGSRSGTPSGTPPPRPSAAPARPTR
ncbi:hypothetical protein MAPG_09201 [Magnaporthiopsis poae ATCC 64411]|uniref:Chitin-binding type-1 domain-containing protein n=1 Tax=Magnaporthiopsis poae (strain ATCC 64411 / 73-15) TaxID=644358 RepID=A0A0C4E9C1_MAGP6|nr:hypothetical protein MAPG_09201 [Magnaporthiopsis poae ATCC 64411]